MRRLPLLLMLPAILLVSAACIRSEIEIRVNEDGSGTAAVLFAFDRATLEALAEGEEIPDPTEDIDPADLPEGAVVEAIDTEQEIGVRVEIPFAASADVGAAIDEAFGALGEDAGPIAGEEGVFEAFSLRQDGDLWRLDATTAVPDLSQEEAAEMALAASLFQNATLTVRIALPGDVTEHNATRVEGDGTLVWELPLMPTEPATLTAVSDTSGGGLNVAVVAGIVIGLLVVAGLGFAYLQRRSRTEAPAAPLAPPADPPAPPAPPAE